jgi:hypothetical protein
MRSPISCSHVAVFCGKQLLFHFHCVQHLFSSITCSELECCPHSEFYGGMCTRCGKDMSSYVASHHALLRVPSFSQLKVVCAVPCCRSTSGFKPEIKTHAVAVGGRSLHFTDAVMACCGAANALCALPPPLHSLHTLSIQWSGRCVACIVLHPLLGAVPQSPRQLQSPAHST